MSFDYKTLYKNHSNQELLKIINQPEQYQPEAIAAAKEILAAREVSEEDEHEVKKEFYNKQVEKEMKAETINAFKETISDKLQYLINPIRHPNRKISPVYWITILVIINVLYYIWYLPSTIRVIIFTLNNEYDNSVSFILYSLLTEIIQLAYTPFFCYLLLKRSKWGWILLTSPAMIMIIAHLYNIYSMYSLQYEISYLFIDKPYNPLYDLVSIGYNVVLLFFVFKEKVREFFSVSKILAKRTIIFTLLLIILYYIFLVTQVF